MKQKLWSKGTVLLFFAALLLVPLYWLIFPQRIYSPTERRYLASAPRLSDQDVKNWTFASDAETYLADHLPLRDALVGLDAYVTWLTGRQVSKDVWVDRDGWLLEAPIENEPEELALRLRRIERLGETTGVQPYVMAVPSAGYVRRNRLPAPLGALYPDGALLNQVDQAQGIISVSLAERFETEGQSWYYRTDHHWTGAGAYAAYEAFMAAAGHTPRDWDAYYHHTVKGYRGSTMSRSALWLAARDTLTVDEPMDLDVMVTFSDREGEYSELFFYEHLQELDFYPLFLDGNHPLTLIENQSAPMDASTLLLVKDSFGNTLAPLLAPSYRTIVMVDPRYYRQSLSALCEKYGVEEILFCYSLERLVTDINLRIIK